MELFAELSDDVFLVVVLTKGVSSAINKSSTINIKKLNEVTNSNWVTRFWQNTFDLK